MTSSAHDAHSQLDPNCRPTYGAHAVAQLSTFYGRGKEAAYQAAASGQAEVLLTTYDQLRLSASRLAALPIHVRPGRRDWRKGTPAVPLAGLVHPFGAFRRFAGCAARQEHLNSSDILANVSPSPSNPASSSTAQSC
jgi:hypothetical protein